MYKSSCYNYFIEKTKDVLVFNGLTKKFFYISHENANTLKHIIQNPDTYFDFNSNIQKLLKDLEGGGFIIPEGLDEKEVIKKNYISYTKSKHYLLMIIPTYTCNFNYWYCVQNHQNKSISPQTIISIKNHISKYLIDNNIQSFELSWFGGEPTLTFPCIYEISDFSKNFCINNNIKFSNDITTNGSLLTNDMIKHFANIDLRNYQITIDGAKDAHNLVKHNNDIKDSFALICNNIIKILDIIPDAEITLRYNYTHDNLTLKVINDLNYFIPRKYRTHILFFQRKVWQINEEKIDDALVSSILQNAAKSGYRIDSSHDLFNGLCYAEKYHFNTIFYNGTVDKCSNIDPSQTRGILDSKGNIQWRIPLSEYDKNLFNCKNECIDCKHLPLCMGTCPINRRKALNNKESFSCNFPHNDKYFRAAIIRYAHNITGAPYELYC